MNLPKYQLSAEKSLMVFEFVSIGKNGRIPKLIKFSETHIEGVFNLGFGDKNENTGEIDDLIVSNNGDSEKVLATVVSAVYAFTDLNTDAWVYATGSTDSRTRLYQIGINKYYEEIIQDFEIYGLFKDKWIEFNKETKFEAFLVRRLLK